YQSKRSSGPSKACANTPYQHTHQFEIWGLGSPVSTGFSEYPKERAARLKKNEISCMGTFRLSLARTIATKRRGNDAHNLKIPME
ncbi:hypothetical protein ABZQ74_31175, partial [Pseudomonas aeruginosa]